MNLKTVLTGCVAMALAACGAALPPASAPQANTSMPTQTTSSSPRPLAPEIKSDVWINSPPLAAKDLRGRVVMVEFWTHGCINCRNVIPELKKMYADYAAQGFTLIGVHSPEFEYEKDAEGVRRAVSEFGIAYPVALDNDFANWKKYRNAYWPAIYLLDKRGALRYTHIGEGAYDITRSAIEQLLAEPF